MATRPREVTAAALLGPQELHPTLRKGGLGSKARNRVLVMLPTLPALGVHHRPRLRRISHQGLPTDPMRPSLKEEALQPAALGMQRYMILMGHRQVMGHRTIMRAIHCTQGSHITAK